MTGRDRTDDLIARLAGEGAPAAAAPLAGRLGLAAVSGMTLAALGAWALGLRADVAAVAPDAETWGKAAVALILAIAAGAVAERLATPGRRIEAALAALALIGLGGAAVAAATAPASAALGMTCAVSITLLSLPGLAAALWSLRGRGALRPAAAGAAAGLMAGAAGLGGFALHCPAEAVAPMLGWYALAGVALVALGALGGRRLL